MPPMTWIAPDIICMIAMTPLDLHDAFNKPSVGSALVLAWNFMTKVMKFQQAPFLNLCLVALSPLHLS